MRFFLPVIRSIILFSSGLLSPVFGISQGSDGDVLLLIHPGTGKFITISTGDRVGYIKHPSEAFRDIFVDSISADTIFFNEGFFDVNRVMRLMVYPDNSPFEPDLSFWVFVTPPADAGSSEDRFRAFRIWIDKNCSPDGSYDISRWRLYISKLQAGHDTSHKNFLKINAARILYLEFAAVYERRLSRNFSIELEGGYQVRSENPKVPLTYYGDTPVYPFSGPLFTIGGKIYGISGMAPYIYLEPQLLYKYVYFEQEWYEDYAETVSVFQDQYRNVYGMSLNAGIQKSYFGMVFDLGVGFGVKYSHINSLCYYYKEPQSGISYYNAEGTPVKQVDDRWYPLLNLMVKIGFGF